MLSTTSPYRALILRSSIIIFLLLALLLTYLVYQPGMSGTFVFDDYPNIANNPSIAIQNWHMDTLRHAAFSSDSGPFKRPISMLSFAANYYFTGFNPFYFKMTNLVIHLANGLGIYVLTNLLLQVYQKRFQPQLLPAQIAWISLAVAAAWILQPFALTSVLYIVQRMTSLSAFFAIWGLVAFLIGRLRLLEGRQGWLFIMISLLVFTPLSALSKETGTLMPAFMLVIEISLFRFKSLMPSTRLFLIVFFLLTVAVPALIFLGMILSDPNWLPRSYVGRTFTLTQRLMTETRVVWFYLRQIVLPNVSEMGLFHDDIITSTSLLHPIDTLFAILGIGGLFIVAWLARKKAALLTFGILFFLAGHALESSVFPLEIAHEHRNYLPMFGILLCVFYYLPYPLKYAANLPLRQIVACLIIVLFAYGTWSRAMNWANPFVLAKSEVENHPNSARDNLEMGNNYSSVNADNAEIMEAYYQKARHYYEQSTVVDPNYTNGLFALIITSALKHKDIQPSWMSELEHRLQYSPSDPDLGNRLIQLFRCQQEQRCKFGTDDVGSLIQAALKNPTLTGARRALVLSSLSYYLIDWVKDYPTAIKVMYETLDNAPQELTYRISLIQVLQLMQRTDEARKQLTIARQLDRLGVFNKQITELDNQLNKK